MKLIQQKGPFSAGCSFKVGGSANEYVHIGIQIPKKSPIAIIKTELPPDVKITTNTGISTFCVPDTGILEFDSNVGTSVTVNILKDLPQETIIDLVCKALGE
nr:MAG TPA: hypothetical protein [Caudoviricetes sp.]